MTKQPNALSTPPSAGWRREAGFAALSPSPSAPSLIYKLTDTTDPSELTKALVPSGELQQQVGSPGCHLDIGGPFLNDAKNETQVSNTLDPHTSYYDQHYPLTPDLESGSESEDETTVGTASPDMHPSSTPNRSAVSGCVDITHDIVPISLADNANVESPRAIPVSRADNGRDEEEWTATVVDLCQQPQRWLRLWLTLLVHLGTAPYTLYGEQRVGYVGESGKRVTGAQCPRCWYAPDGDEFAVSPAKRV
ncbi:hypothetical protein JVU11DRAFT_9421 [Chiua virens]|nr:hypothetical protein JVU11DRAFT_9421 [Chiua virens]